MVGRRIQAAVDASTVPRNPGFVGVAYSIRIGKGLSVSWASCGSGTAPYGELLALSFFLEDVPLRSQDQVVLTTDSMFALKAIEDPSYSGEYAELVSRIRGWIGSRAIQLVHQRGHVGDPGNEAADFHARQAAILCRRSENSPLYVPRGSGPSYDLERILMRRRKDILPGSLRAVLSAHHKFRSGVAFDDIDLYEIHRAILALGGKSVETS